MFQGIVSGFLGFFDSKVSVDIFETFTNECHFSRPFLTKYYTFLYLKYSLISWSVYTVGKWKKLTLKGFLISFNPLIFFKTVFLENYARYAAELFREYYLW